MGTGGPRGLSVGRFERGRRGHVGLTPNQLSKPGRFRETRSSLQPPPRARAVTPRPGVFVHQADGDVPAVWCSSGEGVGAGVVGPGETHGLPPGPVPLDRELSRVPTSSGRAPDPAQSRRPPPRDALCHSFLRDGSVRLPSLWDRLLEESRGYPQDLREVRFMWMELRPPNSSRRSSSSGGSRASLANKTICFADKCLVVGGL